MSKRHCPNPTDLAVTLCSVSREGEKFGPMLYPTMAEPGQQITCGRCRALIALVKHFVGPRHVLKKGWRRLETERYAPSDNHGDKL